MEILKRGGAEKTRLNDPFRDDAAYDGGGTFLIETNSEQWGFLTHNSRVQMCT